MLHFFAFFLGWNMLEPIQMILDGFLHFFDSPFDMKFRGRIPRRSVKIRPVGSMDPGWTTTGTTGTTRDDWDRRHRVQRQVPSGPGHTWHTSGRNGLRRIGTLGVTEAVVDGRFLPLKFPSFSKLCVMSKMFETMPLRHVVCHVVCHVATSGKAV